MPREVVVLEALGRTGHRNQREPREDTGGNDERQRAASRVARRRQRRRRRYDGCTTAGRGWCDRMNSIAAMIASVTPTAYAYRDCGTKATSAPDFRYAKT